MISKKDKLDIPFAVKSEEHNNVKQVDTSKRTIDAIGNTYYYIDTYGDVLLPGCCAKSIQERGPKSELPGKVKHLSNHDLTKGIGNILELQETKYENMDVLWMQSYMSETNLGEETLIKYQEGIIDQHSIGFRYMNINIIEEGSEEFDKMLAMLINPEVAQEMGFMWLINEIKLYEISSLDGFGANRLTPYLGVKSDNKNVQYNNLITKLDALHRSMRSGGDKDMLEMQELQIKQMIYELLNPEPSPKDTYNKPPADDTSTVKLINNFKFLK